MSLPIVDNVKNQARALEQVISHQRGAGGAAMEEARQILRRAPLVVLSGMGSSHFACLPLECRLQARGAAAVSIDAAELLHFRRSICQPKTVVVLISRSGDTVEITRLLPLLRDANVTVIGVTNEPEGSLAKQADLTILLNSPADQLVAIQTYIATVLTLLMLGNAVSGNELDTLIDAMPPWIQSCLDESERWQRWLRPERAMYLFGRGASLASAHEGALLFGEVAKHAAIGASVAQFRHGPVEVVDRDFRAILFASQHATADLDVAFAQDLQRFGADALSLGPRFPRWPSRIAEALAPIVEIVPVQVAAIRMAEMKGFTPGVFRIAGPVTLEESGFAGA